MIDRADSFFFPAGPGRVSLTRDADFRRHYYPRGPFLQRAAERRRRSFARR